MKIEKSKYLSLTLAIVMTFLSAVESHSALSLINGDFQDLTGLTITGGGWYGGVPTGWSGSSFPGYEIYNNGAGSNFVANLNQLSKTIPSFVALRQSAGLLDSSGIVTLTFDVADLSTGFDMNAGIFNTQNSVNYDDWTPLALPPTSITTTGSQTLSTAAPIAAGTYIGVAFWAPSGAPVIDNVNVVPEPSAFSLLVAGSCLTFALAARRRHQTRSL
ncbi:MAG: hypothetical protein EBS97_06525 [Verrucomicrobia bacterium]|nr:hypothetical protein [Verrucomicrobiota bacterium]